MKKNITLAQALKNVNADVSKLGYDYVNVSRIRSQLHSYMHKKLQNAKQTEDALFNDTVSGQIGIKLMSQDIEQLRTG